ncbi:MAG: RagB/SusD family nutrient uptake outer membrane protein [Bacteroidales bacterium]|nr:RagB/SusD family nutrient uptake outer membrane protein [Bacteroidales bacterium]
MKNIFKGIILAGAMFSLASCAEFLNRPTIDNYNTSNFYQTDAQVEQGINYLYNSPWYDFQRGFIKVGEVMSGNMYWGKSPYLSLTTNGTDEDLVNMSYSLWSVNAHCNTVIKNILAAEGPSKAAKDKAIGECLTLKALAYFYLVRTFGEVPIIHDNSDLLGTGEYNTVKKVSKANVYEYIIMNLEEAMKLLPKNAQFGKANRIDYYAAEALLAKVYLTKAGLKGSLDSGDLANAAKYAKDVIDNSGRTLTPKYSDIFRLSPSVYNATGECLISWQWTTDGGQWTRQNSLQGDIQMEGFGDHGDLWGGWGGPSVDLMDAFGVKSTDDPSVRKDEKDTRRKASMMMAGDYYDYFWTDKGGFDFLKFLFDEGTYGKNGPHQMECQTGACCVKHCYGNDADHIAALGKPADRMAYELPTHVLRLGDIYLVYAEAVVNSDNAAALATVNKVRSRAGATPLTSVTMEDIWKERRLELSGEGDYWYDFVRRAYWQPEVVIAELKAQKRSIYNGKLGDVYKNYYKTNEWDIDLLNEPTDDGTGVKGWIEGAANQVWYGKNSLKGDDDAPNVTIKSFTLPFPTEDVVFNGNIASDAEITEVDIRATYPYNF